MRSLIGHRKTASTRLELRGGQVHGVVTTDPAGQATGLAFTGSSSDVLLGDGSFGPATASVAWGSITGTLANQTDLQAALDGKQDLLVFDSVLGAYVIPL